MSKKLEKVLECLLNEEQESAAELLHDFVVEKARNIYQDLVEEEDMEDGMCEDDDMEGDIGGDEKEDFANDIEADMDSDDMDDMDDMEGEEDTEERVADLESALADLRAEFDALMGDSDEDGMVDGHTHDDMSDDMDDMGDEEEMMDSMYESDETLEEATKLQDKVSEPSNSESSDNKHSSFSKAPNKAEQGGKPVSFVSGEEGHDKKDEGKDHTPEDNIDVDHKPGPKAKMKPDSVDVDSPIGSKSGK